MKVFISHSPKDRIVAKKIYENFLSSEIVPCLDCNSLITGRNSDESTLQGVNTYGFFWALPSSDNLRKNNCSYSEIALTRDTLGDLPRSEIFFIPLSTRMNNRLSDESRQFDPKKISLFSAKASHLNNVVSFVKTDCKNLCLEYNKTPSQWRKSRGETNNKYSSEEFLKSTNLKSKFINEKGGSAYVKKIKNLNSLRIGSYYNNLLDHHDYSESNSKENMFMFNDSNYEAKKKEMYLKRNYASFSKLFYTLLLCYYDAGFLYPEKLRRINPYIDLIHDNWKLALKARDELFNIITYREPKTDRMASIIFWRSTNHGWVAQHLIATKRYPAGACAMMMQVQAEVILGGAKYQSFQNWFNPENRFANKIFGSVVQTIGEENSDVKSYKYLAVLPTERHEPFSDIRVKKCNNKDKDDIYEFASKVCGRVYANAEELGSDDLELEKLNKHYRKVGLSRKRFIWMAFCSKTGKSLGAAIAYRGPFGFNFSYIENRCDLLVDPDLDESRAESVCQALLSHARDAYFGKMFSLKYPLKYIPVVTDKRCANIMDPSKTKRINNYNQSIWLDKGFEGWYKNVENISKRLMERIERKLKRETKVALLN